jgi:hypothetical protein
MDWLGNCATIVASQVCISIGRCRRYDDATWFAGSEYGMGDPFGIACNPAVSEV